MRMLIFTAIKDALGNTTAFAYDSFGELTSKTDARGNATTYSHDSFGSLTRITDALGHSAMLAYDPIGRLTSITDPNGHIGTANYDVLSRLIKTADPLGNKTQFAYDAVGNLLKITDANGNATSYAYDATNNLVSVTDALGRATRYSYDANNNRVTFTNAKGNVTSYSYDALNRQVSITDPLSFVTSYSYDPAGNVLAITDPKGQTNQFTYDPLNRLIAISYADGKSVAYSYDADGNRTSMADSQGTTEYAYDGHDRLTSVTRSAGKVVTYAYDAVGNRNEHDDAQVIFETLNAGGKPLAAMDLVRNDVFHRAVRAGENVELLMENRWKAFEEPFWKEPGIRGRIKKQRIDFFLSDTLAAETGKEILLTELYARYKRFVIDRKFASVDSELETLLRHAPTYRKLFEPTDQSALAEVGRELAVFDVTTAYPLVFVIQASEAPEEEKLALYRLIVSYVLRRMICGLTAKNYNNVFLRLGSQLRMDGVSLATGASAFAALDRDTVRFPSNAEFRDAISSRRQYGNIQQHRLQHILCQLEREARDKFDEATCLPDDLTIEHVCPMCGESIGSCRTARRLRPI